MPGKNVVVIGGGAVGCEVAQYLADRGSLSAELLKFLMKERAESIETITGPAEHIQPKRLDCRDGAEDRKRL